MDRDCNKCVHHTSGSCSAWECKGTKTVEDVRADAIEEVMKMAKFNIRFESIAEEERFMQMCEQMQKGAENV